MFFKCVIRSVFKKASTGLKNWRKGRSVWVERLGAENARGVELGEFGRGSGRFATYFLVPSRERGILIVAPQGGGDYKFADLPGVRCYSWRNGGCVAGYRGIILKLVFWGWRRVRSYQVAWLVYGGKWWVFQVDWALNIMAKWVLCIIGGCVSEIWLGEVAGLDLAVFGVGNRGPAFQGLGFEISGLLEAH